VNERVRQSVSIIEFRGWMSNIDAEDIPNGAGVLQVNAVVAAGEIFVRDGLRQLHFDDDAEV
jgi:hypothetical protein